MIKETVSRSEVDDAIDRLVEQYRSRCLWFAPSDYYPKTDNERLSTLRDIETNGDRAAFVRSRELREWLLQVSSELSSTQ
jgi:hypothetical protein